MRPESYMHFKLIRAKPRSIFQPLYILPFLHIIYYAFLSPCMMITVYFYRFRSILPHLYFNIYIINFNGFHHPLYLKAIKERSLRIGSPPVMALASNQNPLNIVYITLYKQSTIFIFKGIFFIAPHRVIDYLIESQYLSPF